jgi:glycerol-3-phosphate dehydrogenase (NAD+)
MAFPMLITTVSLFLSATLSALAIPALCQRQPPVTAGGLKKTRSESSRSRIRPSLNLNFTCSSSRETQESLGYPLERPSLNLNFTCSSSRETQESLGYPLEQSVSSAGSLRTSPSRFQEGNIQSSEDATTSCVSSSRATNMKSDAYPVGAPKGEEQLLDRVCIIGSGNWGSAIATIIGRNCGCLPYFHSKVNMWVYQEQIDDERGRRVNLTHYINTRHENIKYLPGIRLPDNVVAVSDLAEACRNATLLVFVVPHQFLPDLLPTIRKAVHKTCRGVSLIKGLGQYLSLYYVTMPFCSSLAHPPIVPIDIYIHTYPQEFDAETKHPVLISQFIANSLGPDFRCGILMGANVALEVAEGQMCESTLATNFCTAKHNDITRLLFDTPTFRVQHIQDVAGAEVSGALKNVIALGAGFVDGVGLGSNTKAALLRVGLAEIAKFSHLFFANVRDSTFLESCGIADLTTTCYSGRNRRCAQAFAQDRLLFKSSNTNTGSIPNPLECVRQWEDIEARLLNGQKLQGTITAKAVYELLDSRGVLDAFPLIRTVYEIAYLGRDVTDIVHGISVQPEGSFSVRSHL